MRILKDIEPIESSGTTVFVKRDMIREYVEEPLIGCAEIFYDKNIRTLDSSCNKNDEDRTIGIEIAYFQLSDENKEIAKKIIEKYKGDCLIADSWYCQHNGEGACSLFFPTNKFKSIAQISSFFEELASLFKEQDLMYGKYTFDEIKQKFAEEIPVYANLEDIGITLSDNEREEYINGIRQIPDEIIYKLEAKRKDMVMELIQQHPEYIVKEDAGTLHIYKSSILSREDVLKLGYVYDSEQDVYWASQELYEKHIAFLNKEKDVETEISS